jgi:hypothetical protein
LREAWNRAPTSNLAAQLNAASFLQPLIPMPSPSAVSTSPLPLAPGPTRTVTEPSTTPAHPLDLSSALVTVSSMHSGKQAEDEGKFSQFTPTPSSRLLFQHATLDRLHMDVRLHDVTRLLPLEAVPLLEFQDWNLESAAQEYFDNTGLMTMSEG